MANTKRCSTYLAKGGTGKSTSTAHLGAALQQEGHDVLLIDLAGKQDDLATIFGLHDEVAADIASEGNEDYPNVTTTMEENWPNIVDLVGGVDAALDQVTYETEEGVDLIPAHPSLDSLDGELGQVDDASERYSRLKTFLDEFVDESGRYDVVLLDLPGAPNNITYNGLWATRDVLAPVLLGELEIKQARGLEKDLEEIREDYGVDAQLKMLIPNQYERVTNLDAEVLDDLCEEFGDVVAPEVVPKSQQIRNTTSEGRTLFAVDDDELSKTGAEAKEAFATNAKELYQRLR